jgi:hypothetical protein
MTITHGIQQTNFPFAEKSAKCFGFYEEAIFSTSVTGFLMDA